ncbi:MAG: NAD(P)-dependent oxidoreductase [Pseudomonadota bacterium]
MIPILLDPARLAIALIGDNEAAARRVCQLVGGGAETLVVYSKEPSEALTVAAGPRLRGDLPTPEAIGRFDIVYIVDQPAALTRGYHAAAKQAGALVNVEDDRRYCDFHSPAQVRRGDLVLTVSTGGKSPGLAARLRRHLEDAFGPEWAERLNDLDAKRQGWRADGLSLPELATKTDAVIEREGWLS